MIKNNQRIFELHSRLSKLLDSLCFELSVNQVDENCLSLLEILTWKKNQQIDDEQLLELYRSWLESKSITDLFSCRQVETYPKNQFIMNELVQNSFMNASQINKSLEVLNQLYNKIYLEQKPKQTHFIDKIEAIFSYLDSQGNIHLRMSELFFLMAAIIMIQKYTMPINYGSFKLHLDDLRKEMCEINGMVSLRSFKNYFLKLSQTKRNAFLDGLIPVFLEFEKYGVGHKGELPNLMDQALIKWKNFPRFTSNYHEGKKKIEVYKRLFEENQVLFYEDSLSLNNFAQKYGQEFLECLQVDDSVIREFSMLLKDNLNRYVELFVKMSSSYHRLSQPVSHHKQIPETHQRHTKQLNKQKTPLKSTKKNSSLRTRTPIQKRTNILVRRQFGSAERVKSRTMGQITPTKSHRPSRNLHHSYAYSNHKAGLKIGLDKNSIYSRVGFFRNKRVQSYQIVMKRLKGR